MGFLPLVSGIVTCMRVLGWVAWMLALTMAGIWAAYWAAFDLWMLAYHTSGLDYWRRKFYLMLAAAITLGVLWLWSVYRVFVSRKNRISLKHKD